MYLHFGRIYSEMGKENKLALSKLVGYFYYLWEAKSIWKKSNPLKQQFDTLETNSLTLMTVMKYFT